MTIILRLFKASEPARQIDSRTLEAGELSIGRDAGQDWVLDDPGRLISRAHLSDRPARATASPSPTPAPTA